MDISRLDKNERNAAIASAVVVVAGAIAAAVYSTYGIVWLAILAALGMLFVLFQPQLATGVTLPGSRGSLMVALGAIAAVVMVFAVVATLQFVLLRFGLPDLFFLLAAAAAVGMAWAGWQELQGEGGRFAIGTAPKPGPDEEG